MYLASANLFLALPVWALFITSAINLLDPKFWVRVTDRLALKFIFHI